MMWLVLSALALLQIGSCVTDRGVIFLYEKYLVEYGKDLSRLNDGLRLDRFAASLRAVYDCSLAHKSYSCEVNEFSDWLLSEVYSLFSPPPQMPNGGDNSATPTQQSPPSSSHARFPTMATRSIGSELVGTIDHGDNTLGSSTLYAESIDWTTSNNPTGASVITSVRNQGQCGACWAFVTAAAVEASVRINADYSMPLSVQELIDCDSKRNRGCDGGNPVYAYDYAMTSGLGQWSAYPYAEKHSSTCQKSQHGGTRSYIKSYVRAPANNQQVLKDFVTISPVSVGVCGIDESFLFYSSGVYDAADCCTTQNHALLLVGYGRDNNTNLDYWVAMNSWGVRWGEEGFMRLRRSSDSSSGGGQCGLAQSPSMAVGGFIVHQDGPTDIKSALVWMNIALSYLRDNWVYLTLLASLLLSIYSVVMVMYVLLLDYSMYLKRRADHRRQGGLRIALPQVPANIYGSINSEHDV